MGFKIEIKPTEYKLDPSLAVPAEVEKPKRKRATKKTSEDGEKKEIALKSDEPETELSMLQSKTPYKQTYEETNNILRGVVGELGVAACEIGEDLRDIRASKTLRKKYDYIAALQSSRATIMSTTVSAAREMNNSIKSAHELELKRAREMKDAFEQDDVKAVQDTYSAFVSMPVSQNMINGGQLSPLGPMTSDFTLMNPNVNAYAPAGYDFQGMYDQYNNAMTPEQMTMMIEENPHINQIIAYDPATGKATFEIYNSENGQFIQGVPKKSAEMFMNDMEFDFANMQAHNNNLNETYDVMFVDGGTGKVMSQSEVDKMNKNY